MEEDLEKDILRGKQTHFFMIAEEYNQNVLNFHLNGNKDWDRVW